MNKFFNTVKESLEREAIPYAEALVINTHFNKPVSITTPEETFMFLEENKIDTDAIKAENIYRYLDKIIENKEYTNEAIIKGVSNDGGNVTIYILKNGIKIAKAGWYVYSIYFSINDIEAINKLCKQYAK